MWMIVPERTSAAYASRNDRSLRFIRSSMPAACRMVVLWSTEHRAELLADWERARAQLPLRPIAPLA